MTSLKIKDLRNLIAEEIKKSLFEVGEKDKQEDGEDSIDRQIDRYLINYESESKLAKAEGKDFRMTLRRFLLEAEEAEEATEDESADSLPPIKKLKYEDIDIKNFLNSVMRLVDNYDALLEVRNAILRRAVNFLIKGYDKDVSESFKDDLDDTYGIQIGKSKSEVEDDNHQSPVADRAGPSLGA